MCSFSHPITCKKFENFGYLQEGCKNKNCEKLHLNLCKHFMRNKFCKYEEKCKYFHPKKLKNNQKKPENQSENQNEKKLSYARIVARNLHPQNALLGHQHFLGQQVQVQDPFLEQNPQIQQPIVKEQQSNQKQILDLLVSLNQRMTTLESNIHKKVM